MVNKSKPVKCAAGVQGLPVFRDEQVAVIDFVGGTGGKSNGRARWHVDPIEDR